LRRRSSRSRLPEIPSPRPQASAPDAAASTPIAPVLSCASASERRRPHAGAPPILRHLAAVPRTAWIAGGIAAVLVAVASTLFVAREPIHRLVAGQYTLELTTVPAGAVVRVDGTLRSGRTPMTLALEPGEHRVEASYGEYARAAFTIDGERDDVLKRDLRGRARSASRVWTRRRVLPCRSTAAVGSPAVEDDAGRTSRLSFKGAGVRAWGRKCRSATASRRACPPSRRVSPFARPRAPRSSSDGVEDVDSAAVTDGERRRDALDLGSRPGRTRSASRAHRALRPAPDRRRAAGATSRGAVRPAGRIRSWRPLPPYLARRAADADHRARGMPLPLR
jgi:hypothetical protein